MIRITIPCLPPTEAAPNGRYHWAVKAKAVKAFRELAYLYARQAKPDGWVAPEQAVIHLTFVVRDHHRRDVDNLVASNKAAQDALVDAGIIKDDDSMHLIIGSVEVVADKRTAPQIQILIGENG